MNMQVMPQKKQRKIVQIAAVAHDQLGHDYQPVGSYTNVIALCDDGTTWSLVNVGIDKDNWEQLAPIPQDK